MKKDSKMTTCKNCNAQIAANAKICPSCGVKNKKPFYKQGWFIFIVIVLVIGIASSIRAGIKEASDKKVTYTWPQSALVGMIPEPESKYGKIHMENIDYFSIDIYKISKSDFEEYVENCKDSGFTVDYTRYDGYYSADHERGYSLCLNYDEKEKMLSISLSALVESSSADEQSENLSSMLSDEIISGDEKKENVDEEDISIETGSDENEPEEPSEESSGQPGTIDEAESSTATEEVRPEFKEMLDGYEKFINDYCEFMEKYTDSSDANDLSMLADYMRLLEEQVEWSEKVDALGDEEMNDAEAEYYTEVLLRVSLRLAEVAQ